LKDLDDLVEAALLFYGRKKMLYNTPIPLSLEKNNDPRLFTSPLKFPGKLAIDALNNRLFISDSNHNRIVGSLSLFLKHAHVCTHKHTHSKKCASQQGCPTSLNRMQAP
jgi:hypothetical protein